MELQLTARGTDEGSGPPDPAVLPRPPAINTDSVVEAVRSVRARLSLWAIASSVAAGVLTFASGGSTTSRGPAIIFASLAAATCTAVAWHARGRAQLAWGAIGLGSGLWCAGSRSRPMWETAREGTAINLTIGGVAALAAMVVLAAGLLFHIERAPRRVARMRSLAEGLMLAASTVFASWVIIMPPAFEATAGRAFGERVVLLSFPASQVLLASIVVFAVTRIPQLGRWSVLLLVGVGATTLLSSASSQVQPTDLARLHALDAGTAVAFLAITVGAAQAWRPAANSQPSMVPERAQLLLLSAPGLSVLIVVGTTLRQVTGKPVAAELTYITIGVLTLSVLLHVTVVLENLTLSADLALARDEAILASNLKSQFLANVSHEIRTPMNAVIGLTGLLLDTELEEDQRELAVGVATSAEGLLGLIDAVLDFSKIEAEKVDLEEIDLDLDDLIDDVAMIVGDSARRKGIDLHAYCEPGLVTARRGDPVRLRQILLNLANNAVKFTSEGSVTVHATPVDGQPDHVAFYVIDTGIGIPEEAQARLFEPFSQLDESTTRKYGGTGLGLGIVTSLVELQGGTITLVSEVGRGTAFRVVLPLPVGSEQAPQSAEQGLSALVGLRALVVDQNAVNRSVLAHTLQSWGFVVDQATNSEEALHHYAWTGSPEVVYALVIIEHRMSGMDGLQLARILRSQRPTASAVTMLLSSQVDLSRQAAHDAGIKSVLIKPVRNTYLLRRIIDALITTPALETTGSSAQRKEAADASGPAR